MYFEIKTLDVERIDIELSEGAMDDRHFAATPWEVEAERRREVLAADAETARSVAARAVRPPSIARGRRWLASLRGTPAGRVPQAGKLNQKRV